MMALQNRVQPTGDIIAHPARGLFTGNRGIIHRDDRTLRTSRWSHHAWICCVLDWQGRKRVPMTGRNWTELFFLDEATALSAGHRPCGYCRRTQYNQFANAWGQYSGNRPKAPQMDKALHRARIVPRTRDQLTHSATLSDLPDGVMIADTDGPSLVWQDTLRPYARDGYGAPKPRPTGIKVTVLTPKPIVNVLRAGYAPVIHPSAGLSDTDIV